MYFFGKKAQMNTAVSTESGDADDEKAALPPPQIPNNPFLTPPFATPIPSIRSERPISTATSLDNGNYNQPLCVYVILLTVMLTGCHRFAEAAIPELSPYWRDGETVAS